MNKNNKVAIIVTANFEREAKKLLKKYPSLKQEIFDLSEKLRHNPGLGVKLSHNVYKIRVAVKSKGKGKRGGLRVITYVVLNKLEEETTEVYLVSVYDKSYTGNISNSLLKYIIGQIKKSGD